MEIGEQQREPAVLVGRRGGIDHPRGSVVGTIVEQALEDGADLARESEFARRHRTIAVTEVMADPIESSIGEPSAQRADDPAVERRARPRPVVGGHGQAGGLVDRGNRLIERIAREEEIDGGNAALEGGELVIEPALHAAAADDHRDRRHGIGGPVVRERRGQAPDQPLGLGVAVCPECHRGNTTRAPA